MRWKTSLGGQFLLLQLTIVLVAVSAVAGVSLAESYATFEHDEGRLLRSVAERLSATAVVMSSLAEIDKLSKSSSDDSVGCGKGAAKLLTPEDRQDLASYCAMLTAETDRVRREAPGVGHIIAIGDVRGRLLTGADAGRQAVLGSSRVLTGGSWMGTLDDGGRMVVVHTPIVTEDGLVGFVVAGHRYPPVTEMLKSASPNLLVYLLLGATLGLAGSLLLARRVKRQTLGLEPAEIAGLVEHREAVIYGIKEGVIGTDANDRVNLVNREAIRLLGLPPDAVGRSLLRQPMERRLRDVLTGQVAGADQVVLRDDRILVLNRMPVVIRGRRVGSVTTLRDHTELTALQRELDISRHTTNTLRAQAHEFANRLHTIAGLVELGEYEEVVGYVARASQAQQSLTRAVTSNICDPSLAALLIAKASLAAEQGVQLRISPTSALASVDDAVSIDLVTIVGNLVDNALDELRLSGWIEVELRTEAGEVIVTVSDSGPGVPPEAAKNVFEEGYTTKATANGHRGLGLALIRLICTRRGGAIEVCGSTFSARFPLHHEVLA